MRMVWFSLAVLAFVRICFSADHQRSSEQMGGRDVAKISYERLVQKDTTELDQWDEYHVTLFKYPVITGLLDTKAQRALNRFLMHLLIDTLGTGMNPEDGPMRRLDPSEDDPDNFADQYIVEVKFLDAAMLSYEEESYWAMGAHPSTQFHSATISIDSLKPIRLKDVFADGYKAIFKNVVHQRVDSSQECFGRSQLQSWFEFIDRQDVCDGIIITESKIVLSRDLEQDFGCGHADGGLVQISVANRALKEVIRKDGPLGRYTRGEH